MFCFTFNIYYEDESFLFCIFQRFWSLIDESKKQINKQKSNFKEQIRWLGVEFIFVLCFCFFILIISKFKTSQKRVCGKFFDICIYQQIMWNCYNNSSRITTMNREQGIWQFTAAQNLDIFLNKSLIVFELSAFFWKWWKSLPCPK